MILLTPQVNLRSQILISCTYYVDRTGHPCANGLSYVANRRRYGHFCASNSFALGSRLVLTSRGGHRITAVVVDRIGHGTQLDADSRTFRLLAGPRWQIIGRLHVRVQALRARSRCREGR